MKLDVFFDYTENEIPPRCRKARPVKKTSKVVLNIPEVDVNELKIAFVVKDSFSQNVIYSYKGKLYKIAESREEGEMIRDTVGGLCNLLRYHGTIHSDLSEAQVKKELRKDAKNYLVSGKTVYRVTGEPRYCVYTFGLGHNHGSTALSVDYCFNENIAKSRYFTAMEYEKALQKAIEIATKRCDTDSIGRLANSEYIYVLDESAVKCKPSKHGDGNPIINKMQSLTEGTNSAEESALLIMASL